MARKTQAENEQYWIARQKRLFEEVEKDEQNAQRRLFENLKREEQRVEKEIASFYSKYADRDDVVEYRKLMVGADKATRDDIFERWEEFAALNPEYAHLAPTRQSIYRLNRLQAEQESIRLQMAEFSMKEAQQVLQNMNRTADKSFTAYCEALSPHMASGRYNGNISIRFEDVGQRVIGHDVAYYIENAALDGSDGIIIPTDAAARLMENRQKLADYMNTDLARAFARGDSSARIVKDLSQRFTRVSQNDLYRLVYTENTHVMAETGASLAEQVSKEYDFVSYNDDKVCQLCRALQNGGPYRYEDRQAGVNFPPIHPFCRCSTAPHMPSFEEWKNSQLGKYLDKFVERMNG